MPKWFHLVAGCGRRNKVASLIFGVTHHCRLVHSLLFHFAMCYWLLYVRKIFGEAVRQWPRRPRHSGRAAGVGRGVGGVEHMSRPGGRAEGRLLLMPESPVADERVVPSIWAYVFETVCVRRRFRWAFMRMAPRGQCVSSTEQNVVYVDVLFLLPVSHGVLRFM